VSLTVFTLGNFIFQIFYAAQNFINVVCIFGEQEVDETAGLPWPDAWEF